MALEEPTDDARQGPIARGNVEPIGDFHQGEVCFFLDPPQDHLQVGGDPMRALIATALVVLKRSAGPRALDPADRRRNPDPEPFGSRSAGWACFDGIDHATAQINGEKFGHKGWPPSPAVMLNQIRASLGIRSVQLP